MIRNVIFSVLLLLIIGGFSWVALVDVTPETQTYEIKLDSSAFISNQQ